MGFRARGCKRVAGFGSGIKALGSRVLVFGYRLWIGRVERPTVPYMCLK